MKKHIIFIILSFFLSLGIAKANIEINNYSLLGRVIYLDAGHGGPDSGAINSNILEKDVNLKIVKNLEAILTSKGAVVLLTRNGDYELSTAKFNRKRNDLLIRAQMIDKSKCDLYLSIHLNSMNNTSWRGLQLFYNNQNNNNNEILAKVIHDKLSDNYLVRDSMVDNELLLLKNVYLPGVLIEVGFMSNNQDLLLILDEDYQNSLSQDIVKGIENYFQNS